MPNLLTRRKNPILRTRLGPPKCIALDLLNLLKDIASYQTACYNKVYTM